MLRTSNLGFSATLVSRRDLSSTVYLLVFRPESKVEWLAGQFFQIWVPVESHGMKTRKKKSYSVASAPRADGTFDICIKRVEGGLTSNALYLLPLNTSLDFEFSSGHFVINDEKSDVVMLASGTGISPFRAMLQDFAKNGFSRRVTLVQGVRTESDIVFRDEFEALAKRFSKFQYVPTLSRGSVSWDGKRGYVQSHLSDVMEESSEIDFYICGLAPMITACVEDLKKLGVPRERIHREVYT